MAKKVIQDKNYIISEYTNIILEEDKKPHTVFHFCKKIKIEEATFYKYFPSFEHLESSVFESFFENTMSLLSKSEEYETYDAKTKLLSFYFTFFEQLTANRSLVIYLLGGEKMKLANSKKLTSLKKHYAYFIDNLGIETIQISQQSLEKIRNKGISEAYWIQFLLTLKFWLDDTSASFEKTDIYIEKSVHASFDLLDMTALKSLMDFGKFIWKEKISM